MPFKLGQTAKCLAVRRATKMTTLGKGRQEDEIVVPRSLSIGTVNDLELEQSETDSPSMDTKNPMEKTPIGEIQNHT